MPEVVTLGETMVMFSPEGHGPLRYVHRFEKRLAGSESNVAIGLGRLGHSCGWISRVGQDEFGRYLLKELKGEGVDTSQVKIDPKAPTGIMFKEMRTGRETRVYYYRHGSAAGFMVPDDLNEDYIGSANILHITGITPALSASCLDTVYHAIDTAREKGVLVSFDPNIRLKLWSMEKARQVLMGIIPKVDIIMPGLDEAQMLLGTADAGETLDTLLALGIKIIAVKTGPEGCWVANKGERFKVPGFPVDKVVDPIGAGDAFAAGFLAGILEKRTLFECGRLANAMGAMAVTTPGDYEGLPLRSELESFIGQREEITR